MSTILTCWDSRELVGVFPNTDPMLGIDIPIHRYLHPMLSYREHTSLLYMTWFPKHRTTIDQRAPSSSAGVQPPTSSGGGTNIGADRLTSCVPQSEPHIWTSCQGPCYGPRPRHATTMMTGVQVRTLF